MKKVVNKWKHSVCAAHTKLNAKNIQGVGLKKNKTVAENHKAQGK